MCMYNGDKDRYKVDKTGYNSLWLNLSQAYEMQYIYIHIQK